MVRKLSEVEVRAAPAVRPRRLVAVLIVVFFSFCQRSLSNTEDECTHLKEMSERGQEELGELANKYNAAVNEIKELTDKIKVRAQAG